MYNFLSAQFFVKSIIEKLNAFASRFDEFFCFINFQSAVFGELKNLVSQEIFRQINYLVISVVEYWFHEIFVKIM